MSAEMTLVTNRRDTPEEAVAREIRAELARWDVSGAELARRLGRPQASVGRWLRGKGLGLAELELIQAATGIDIAKAVGEGLANSRSDRPALLPLLDSNQQPAGQPILSGCTPVHPSLGRRHLVLVPPGRHHNDRRRVTRRRSTRPPIGSAA